MLFNAIHALAICSKNAHQANQETGIISSNVWRPPIK